MGISLLYLNRKTKIKVKINESKTINKIEIAKKFFVSSNIKKGFCIQKSKNKKNTKLKLKIYLKSLNFVSFE